MKYPAGFSRNGAQKNYKLVIGKIGQNLVPGRKTPLLSNGSATALARRGSFVDLFVFLRIARNFIRAFWPTLILLVSWDLWRRLAHAAPANPTVLVIDTILLGVVIFLGLASRFKEAHKQLRYLFRLSNNAFYAAFIIFPLAISFKSTPANRPDVFLLLASSALVADIVRVCKIRILISPGIYLIAGSFGFFAYVISGLVSRLGEVWEDAAKWSTALTYTANVLVMIILRAFAHWREEQQSFPTIQRLGLNSEEHPVGRTPSSTSTANVISARSP